jgi:CSLREA domain-containing protein
LAVIALALLALVRMTEASPATVFYVDTTLDEADDNTADNVCHPASSHCSLRAAVQQADQLSGVIILVPAFTYVLTDTVRGNLNVSSDMTIQGANANTTTIKGNPAGWTHRIMHVADGVTGDDDEKTLTAWSVQVSVDARRVNFNLNFPFPVE